MFKLTLGDSLEIMRRMPDMSVDAIITDPPYGLEYRKNEWDRHIPDWIEDARRISPIVIFTTAPTTIYEYPPADWICIWHRRAAASRSPSGGFNHWSPILVYGKVKFSIDYYETMFGKTVNENKGIEHPSPKPLELYKWLVSQATQVGQTVLDPFLGSGTTGVACMQLKRDFIGIEKEAAYLSIAQERIQEASNQLVMVF
jgi:site-specific DNA-methyltransferase (adenine-specific)